MVHSHFPTGSGDTEETDAGCDMCFMGNHENRGNYVTLRNESGF